MGSRIYTVQFSAIATTATQDLWEFVAAAAKPIEIIGIDLSQTSDFGDGQEEVILVQIKAGQTTTGSGGTSVTPVPTNFSDVAAGFTAVRNNTTKATSGTIVTHLSTGWNVRSPGMMLIPDEFRFIETGGRRTTIEITAPADSITLNSTIWVREYG